jgi:hypothetical protein
MTGNAAPPHIELIATADLPAARLDALTRDLARDLSRNRQLSARPAEQAAGVGERGVPTAIGQIVVEVLGELGIKSLADASKALAEAFKAYLLREKTLKLHMVAPDGSKIVLDSKNISPAAIEAFLKVLQKPRKTG